MHVSFLSLCRFLAMPYFGRSLRIVWMGSVAQYVVFLCSCDIRILVLFFFFALFSSLVIHTFLSLYFSSIPMLYIWCLTFMRPCVLRSFTSQYTRIGILQDLLWLSAPNGKESRKKTTTAKHLSIYTIAKYIYIYFSLLFHILFFFYVGRRTICSL